MSDYQHLIGKYIDIEISGKNFCKGTLLDIGLDIIVVYNNKTQQFFYIPIVHIQRLKEATMDETLPFVSQPEIPLASESISFRKILTNAKGQFVQIYVTGNKSIHGYLTSIMNDYFVFYSPAYKTLFISMHHVKWLIPYNNQETTPYSLSHQHLPVNPTSIPLARTFEEQCKKLENHIVVIDGGDNSEKIGLVQKVGNNRLALVTAERETVYWNLQHIKTIHLP
ncbi:DUF2642 domain-containing protein [Polycladomyces sp. WAk]|uniref:DUF2642 domain-containing protein n=1 Tax=Polycladomyces zharkentensis TaxID=2807616 RepID=A0ABS2WJK8_9BACL|nr:DUF2642 domain-containing protein [Polycladomyces sp. WAk]MBN2909737.1 DUF2642 domain-containing protein [Polycladomyces sp. WAk]